MLKALNEKRLCKKYARTYRTLLAESLIEEQQEDNYEFRLWSLWFQGEDAAPEIVKKCWSSIRKFYGEKLIILTSQNLHEYVNLPSYIEDKYQKGYISAAHYSDLVRLELLAKYGGAWIDSTCYMTSKIPFYIEQSELFAFQSPKSFLGAIRCSSWFLISKPGSGVLKGTLALLLEYWRTHNSIADYLLFHLFMSIVINSKEETLEIWERIPYYNNDTPHIMGRELLQEYSKERFDELEKMSFVHKLSYKIPDVGNQTMLKHILTK